jgi:lipoyl(octanoyl) transferase
VKAALSDRHTAVVRELGCVDYAHAFADMQAFSATRDADTPDEIWLLTHPPVYTMGLKGRGQAFAPIGGIPVVQTDRGGDITYHGPGQLVAYLLLDINRRRLGPKELVRRIEASVIGLLGDWGVHAERRAGAPGVYVTGRKLAALGLRVRNGRTYHGLSLNVDMDLAPFRAINPCGYAGLEVTQLRDLALPTKLSAVGSALLNRLMVELGYTAEAAPRPRKVVSHG